MEGIERRFRERVLRQHSDSDVGVQQGQLLHTSISPWSPNVSLGQVELTQDHTVLRQARGMHARAWSDYHIIWRTYVGRQVLHSSGLWVKYGHGGGTGENQVLRRLDADALETNDEHFEAHELLHGGYSIYADLTAVQVLIYGLRLISHGDLCKANHNVRGVNMSPICCQPK